MSKPIHGKEFSFTMTVSLDDLIDMGGMDSMNDRMDDEFHAQFGYGKILTDITYQTLSVNKENEIAIKVTGIVDKY